MELRAYQKKDLPQMAALFYETVHTVSARDYTPEQLNAWATGKIDEDNWHHRYSSSYTLLAVMGEKVLGFGNIDDSGYLDMLYVHKDHQRCGIATLLCDALEKHCEGCVFTVHASITARPFFLKRGYRQIKEQTVERGGVCLTNYIMEKSRE